jgi:hypothetical protein
MPRKQRRGRSWEGQAVSVTASPVSVTTSPVSATSGGFATRKYGKAVLRIAISMWERPPDRCYGIG